MGNILQRNQVEEACILEQTVLAMMGRELVSRAWEEVWRLGVRRGSSGKGDESLLCCRSERVSVGALRVSCGSVSVTWYLFSRNRQPPLEKVIFLFAYD